MKFPSFTTAMKQYFGLKDGQTIGEFASELKALTHEAKMEFHAMLNAAGYECPEPTKIA